MPERRVTRREKCNVKLTCAGCVVRTRNNDVSMRDVPKGNDVFVYGFPLPS